MRSLRLSIVIAAMASLSTALLGMGQGSVALPALTILAALGSVVLTDMLRWFRLHRVLANAAMVAAAIFALSGFLGASSLEQLHAIAQLLTYVEIVLFFQEKSVRIYGQLAMFSLLQIVVAALLNDSLVFGVLLVVYAVVALGGIALFFVYREVEWSGVIAPRRRGFAFRPAREVAPAGARRDLLRGGPPVIELVDSRATLFAAVLTWHVLPPFVGLLGAILVFATAFFYSTPRTGGANWERGAGMRSMVGYSPEVSFEDLGQVLLSQARVMRVSFSDLPTGEVYTVMRQPYFRGTVLTRYLTANGHGQWRQEIEPASSTGLPLSPPPTTDDLVRLDIRLEPTGSAQLFGSFPAYAIAETPGSLRVGPRTRRLYRVGVSLRALREDFRYAIATTAFRYGAQYLVAPYPSQLDTPEERSQLERMTLRLQFLDSRQEFPQLIALADQIVQARAPGGNHYEKARALEAHFLEPRRYTYSLEMDEINARRRPDVDPVEDFVSNHRMGHCEYFASALTLMLRSQGIPAHMVVGYRGGEFNYVGDYLVVRQADAHAWVEAYLPPEEIPPDAICPAERHAGGGWLRLDPTPAAFVDEADERSLLDRASKSFDYARWLWNDYVLRLTSARQRESLLRPLGSDYEIPVADLLSGSVWRRLSGRGDSSAAGWGSVSWRGISAAVLACALAWGVYWLSRACWPLLRRAARTRRRTPARPPRQSAACYRRLESLLARLGLHRASTQTPREFARVAAAQLAAAPDRAAAAAIPEAIVDAFYRIRFGQWLPDDRQEAEIAAQLQKLEQTLTPGARPR